MWTEKRVFLKDKSSGQLISIEETIFLSDISKEDFGFLTITQFKQGEKFIIIAYKAIYIYFNFTRPILY